MARKKPPYRRRRFKPTSKRRHSVRDLAVLEFLWTWKVASSPMLKEHAFKGKSEWWTYKALRQLEEEKYILRLPRGRNIEQELWTLTDHGFEVVLMNRDDIKEYRYRVHAPAHDFLATCLQLGEVWLEPFEKRFFTEQMLASLALYNFPKSFREVKDHVPDGMTLFPGAIRDAVVGYEVDLNLKEDERYKSTFNYYQRGVKPNLVVWLIKAKWMAARIEEACLQYAWAGDAEAFQKKFAFILLDDFKERIWGAEAISGALKGMSIRKLHANLLQTLGKDTPNIGQKPVRELFFPRFKSPQETTAYKKGGILEIR